MVYETAVHAALSILDTPEAEGGFSDDQKILHASEFLRLALETATPATPPVVPAPDASVTLAGVNVAPVDIVAA